MSDITLQTKIAQLMSDYPELEQTLLELSPAFAKLQNPVLRKTIARVTSVQQAASIAGLDPAHMLTMLRKAAGLETTAADSVNSAESQHLLSMPVPDWFSEEAVEIKYNATKVLEKGNVPMAEIIEAAKKINGREIFLFVTPFVPAPIVEILNNKGYAVWCRKAGELIENFVIKK